MPDKKFIEIVPARLSHLPGMLKVWQDLMNFHRPIDPYFATNKEAPLKIARWLRRFIRSRNWQAFVALDKSKVVAIATIKIENYPPIFRCTKYGEIDMLAVKSGYRRCGIGKRLLTEIRKWVAVRKIKRIELAVASKNKIGYPFWRKQGFKDYMHTLKFINR